MSQCWHGWKLVDIPRSRKCACRVSYVYIAVCPFILTVAKCVSKCVSCLTQNSLNAVLAFILECTVHKDTPQKPTQGGGGGY